MPAAQPPITNHTSALRTSSHPLTDPMWFPSASLIFHKSTLHMAAEARTAR